MFHKQQTQIDMKQLLPFLLLFSFTTNCFSQFISFTDETFKNALVQNSEININEDEEISEDEAAAFSGIINISGLGIGDLKGIEYFTEITRLAAFDNFLEEIDLSANVNLEQLLLEDNMLQGTLNLENQLFLTDFKVHSNFDLKYINLSNGNNVNMTRFEAQDCFELICVQVDDAEYSTLNWLNIPASAQFNEDCQLNTSLSYLKETNLAIYPNPSSDIINLRSDDKIENFEIYDLNGSKVTVNIEQNQSINISTFNNGIYFLRIKSNEEIKSYKFIKI